jgi:multiple sugar transport system substrate-binding protein
MKRFLLSAVFALAAGAAQAVELKLWTSQGLSPSSPVRAVADAYKDLYARFAKENPNIKLNWELVPSDISHLLTAASAGTLPDVALTDAFWIARLVQTGKLQPLDELWPQESRKLFDPKVIAASTVNGRLYTAWFHNAWRGNFYRTDKMKELGFDAAPRDWAEFEKVATSAKAAGLKPIMYPGTAHEFTALRMLSMFWGLGGELVDKEGAPIFFEGQNKGKLESVFQLYKTLVDKGFMPREISTLDEASLRPYLYSGEALVITQTSSSLTQIYSEAPQLKGKISAFNYPMPTNDVAVPVLVGNSYSIFTSDPERKAAAWRFIEFVLRPENLGILNEVSGHLPVVAQIWDRPFYKDDPLMRQLRSIYDSGGMRPRPAVPIYPALTLAWATQVADVITGKVTPAQAVENARQDVMREYRRISAR